MAAFYTLLNTDFAWYPKVVVDRPAFEDHWAGSDVAGPSSRRARLTNPGIWESMDEASASFAGALVEAYVNVGYQPVDHPGPEVLQVSTLIVSVPDDAHEHLTVGPGRDFGALPSEPLLVLEVRDSMSAVLMGRAVERPLPGQALRRGAYFRDQIADRAHCEQMFGRWAKISAERMASLEAMWPMTVHA